VIRTEGLTKSYGRARGLDGLDLQVRPGEVFGLLGPDGAGKTTLVRILLDLVRPTGGQVRVLGLDPRADSLQVRRRTGYLPARVAVSGRQTAGDFLAFLGNLAGGASEVRVSELAGRLGLDLSRSVRSLPADARRKLGLVQAFMRDPELLVLDEPTSVLDPAARQEVVAMVGEARAAGRTVLLATRVRSEAQQVCDRVGILRHGRLLTVETAEELRRRAVHKVEIHFDAPVPAAAFAGLPGVGDLQLDGAVLRCTLNGNADALVKAAAEHTVLAFLSAEPPLEDALPAGDQEGAAVGDGEGDGQGAGEGAGEGAGDGEGEGESGRPTGGDPVAAA
jgi:ABC-2 type transport system ATP-binding protein